MGILFIETAKGYSYLDTEYLGTYCSRPTKERPASDAMWELGSADTSGHSVRAGQGGAAQQVLLRCLTTLYYVIYCLLEFLDCAIHTAPRCSKNTYFRC